MRLILDGVFNHTAIRMPGLTATSDGRACHNPDSPWRDWFTL
jgi:glycosidase